MDKMIPYDDNQWITTPNTLQKYDYIEHFTPGNCDCDIVMTEGAFTSQRWPISDHYTHVISFLASSTVHIGMFTQWRSKAGKI